MCRHQCKPILFGHSQARTRARWILVTRHLSLVGVALSAVARLVARRLRVRPSKRGGSSQQQKQRVSPPVQTPRQCCLGGALSLRSARGTSLSVGRGRTRTCWSHMLEWSMLCDFGMARVPWTRRRIHLRCGAVCPKDACPDVASAIWAKELEKYWLTRGRRRRRRRTSRTPSGGCGTALLRPQPLARPAPGVVS